MNITNLETTPSAGKDKNQTQKQHKKKALTYFMLQFLAFPTLLTLILLTWNIG